MKTNHTYINGFIYDNSNNNDKNIKIFSNLWNDYIKTAIDYRVKLLNQNYNN